MSLTMVGDKTRINQKLLYIGPIAGFGLAREYSFLQILEIQTTFCVDIFHRFYLI